MSHPSANRVLVVDDSPGNRTLVAACLRRPHLTFDAKLPSGKRFIGAYDVDLTQDFLQALVNHARICLHVNVRRGRNLHHVVEAIFKATARALREATAREAGAGVPSFRPMLAA